MFSGLALTPCFSVGLSVATPSGFSPDEPHRGEIFVEIHFKVTAQPHWGGIFIESRHQTHGIHVGDRSGLKPKAISGPTTPP